jgi:glycosyltransferase involved in cell wall biosynthesis
MEAPTRGSPLRVSLPVAPGEKRGWPFTDASHEHAPWLGRGGNWPRISIVTPSYNQARFLEQTLQSVLRQDYPNLEYIVIDGDSSDDSVDIIRKYSPWLHHWTSAPDQGQSDAINKGFESSSGEVLGWLNSDDFLAPATLFKVADAVSEAPDVGAVVGIGHKIDRQGRRFYSPLPERVTSESLLGWCDGNNFMQPACFFTRAAWQGAGPLRMDLDYCMDLALWFKIAEQREFKILPETLAFIRRSRAFQVDRVPGKAPCRFDLKHGQSSMGFDIRSNVIAGHTPLWQAWVATDVLAPRSGSKGFLVPNVLRLAIRHINPERIGRGRASSHHC